MYLNIKQYKKITVEKTKKISMVVLFMDVVL